MGMMQPLRRLALLLAIVGLAGCANAPDPLTQDLPDMGSFRLGHNIVVSENARIVPPSRTGAPEDWQRILQEEIDRRFGRYEGAKEFHIALNVDGYALAVPGIPLIISPKSILVVSANVWSEEERRKLHEDSEQLTVFEGGGEAVLGSGLTKTAEEQMRNLARNMAWEVQKWMLTHPEWFDLPPLQD